MPSLAALPHCANFFSAKKHASAAMTATPVVRFRSALEALPIIAILRGVKPNEVCEVADVLIEAGIRIIEVPLNSESPEASIETLAKHVDAQVVVGAGTVLDTDAARRVHSAGGQLVVAPNINTDVVTAAAALGMATVPGVATPTEAFTAVHAGATGLKLFPAEQASPAVVKAWRAVLPKDMPVFAVGGIQADNMAPWWQAGAAGFGVGSALYKPGIAMDELRQRAQKFVAGFAAI